MVRSSFRILVLFGFLASAHGGSPAPRGDAGEPWLIQPLDFVPATRGELSKSFSSAYTKRVEVLADRHEYFADDVNAQFLVMFFDKVKARLMRSLLPARQYEVNLFRQRMTLFLTGGCRCLR